MTTTARPRRAGRPPKIVGGAMRWWLYVNPDRRAAAEQRATSEGVELPDVLRAFLDGYASGLIATPRAAYPTIEEPR